jgi:hypothetical protein
MNRIKVTIVYGTEPNFEKDAFEYFILNVNKIQTVYEFSFPDICDENGKQIHPKFSNNEKKINFSKSLERIDNFVTEKGIISDYCIAIITKSFENNYFFNAASNSSVITTDIWEKHFSPPTLFEYLLHSIYTCLMYSKVVSKDKILEKEQLEMNMRSHSDMRGCIADLTRQKYQDRIAITLGHICEEHKEKILQVYGKEYLEQFLYVIGRSWIGEIDEISSVAYNLRHIFKFNINKDSGFNKTWWEKFQSKFYEIPGTLIGDVLKLLITVFLTYFLIKWGLIEKK